MGWCRASLRSRVTLLFVTNFWIRCTHSRLNSKQNPSIPSFPAVTLCFYFCIFLASPALNTWHKAAVWPHHHPLYSKIECCIDFRAGPTPVCSESWQQSRLVGRRLSEQTAQTKCLHVTLFFFVSRCLLEWIWLVTGRESTEAISLAWNNLLHLFLPSHPPPPPFASPFWCHTSRGGRNAEKGKQQQWMSFSPELSGRVRLQAEHTQMCARTYTTLCGESTSCLTFAHSWWLKCENSLAGGLGSGWGLAQFPLKPKKKREKLTNS